MSVDNAPPEIRSLGLASATVGENSLVSVAGSVSDAGIQDTHTVSIGWGDGSTSDAVVDANTRTFTAEHRYADDDPTGTPWDDLTIIAIVEDDGGAIGNRSTTVTVTNMPPIVTALKVDEVNDDGWVTLSGSFNDASLEDTHSVLIDWSDGTTSEAVVDEETRTFTATHQYADNGAAGGTADSYFIVATITDDDSGKDTASAAVVNEGGTAANRGDIPGVDADSLTASVGDVVDNGDGTWNWSFETTDGPEESQAVIITATDSQGAELNTVFNLVVNNVAPNVTAATDQTCEEDSPAIFALGSFVDPGDDDPWTVDVDWGDGSTSDTFSAASTGSLGTRSHTYANPGVYAVTVTVQRKRRCRGIGECQFRGDGGRCNAAQHIGVRLLRCQ